jgi:hypothetical protein
MSEKNDNIKKLEIELGNLAGQWRYHHSLKDFEQATHIVEKYSKTMENLWDQGWHGDDLLPTEELPDRLMPKYFLEYWQRVIK